MQFCLSPSLNVSIHVAVARYHSNFWQIPLGVRHFRLPNLKFALLKIFPGMNHVLQPGSEKDASDLLETNCRSVSNSNPESLNASTCLEVVNANDDAFYYAFTDKMRQLHGVLDTEEDARERSARQTAAARVLWNHVIHDPLANIMAGESHLRNLQLKMEKDKKANARERAGVMLAVRTLWFDVKLEEALKSLMDEESEGSMQVVLLGAGMDTRAYRLECLEGCVVFEVDLPKILDVKRALIECAIISNKEQETEEFPQLKAKRVARVAADLAKEDWLDKLQAAGYQPNGHGTKTVWLMEGILYYLQDHEAKAVLRRISSTCPAHTIVLADFMNEFSTHLAAQLHTNFYFHSDWPEELLPLLGFAEVRVSQMGDPDANFGLIDDHPLCFFHRLRRIPRYSKSDADGNPCRRLFLVQCSVAA